MSLQCAKCKKPISAIEVGDECNHDWQNMPKPKMEGLVEPSFRIENQNVRNNPFRHTPHDIETISLNSLTK